MKIFSLELILKIYIILCDISQTCDVVIYTIGLMWLLSYYQKWLCGDNFNFNLIFEKIIEWPKILRNNRGLPDFVITDFNSNFEKYSWVQILEKIWFYPKFLKFIILSLIFKIYDFSIWSAVRGLTLIGVELKGYSLRQSCAITFVG